MRRAALPLLGPSLSEVVTRAALAAIPPDDATPREWEQQTKAERRRAMLAELYKLSESKPRQAAMIVARRYARDRHDLVEVGSIAQWLRRRRRNSRRFSTCDIVSRRHGTGSVKLR